MERYHVCVETWHRKLLFELKRIYTLSWINSYYTRNSCSSGDNLVSFSGTVVKVKAMSLGERWLESIPAVSSVYLNTSLPFCKVVTTFIFDRFNSAKHHCNLGHHCNHHQKCGAFVETRKKYSFFKTLYWHVTENCYYLPIFIRTRHFNTLSPPN